MADGIIFEPFTINGVEFRNRVLRSSIGGRHSFYDGTPSPTFTNFEKRFALGGVAGIISATITIDDERWPLLEYPRLSHDRFLPAFRRAVREIKSTGARYIIQLGDVGAHTQLALISKDLDEKSSSRTFDLLYGYRSLSSAMTIEEIERVVANFAAAARRVREAGCDGVEITASKGYLIQQFLNPAINRRTDAYGGSADNRFRLLEQVVRAVRAAIGADFLFGIRLSAADYNYLPVNLRLPVVWPLKDYFFGNTLETNLDYARRLEALGVDYLHIDSGYGFVNPKGNPGTLPVDAVRNFFNYNRHLSAKAWFRAMLLNLIPLPLANAILNLGWKINEGGNADFAAAFKYAVTIPVISNGGFQRREVIEDALAGKCDIVSMARPLLANPDLLQTLRRGRSLPDRPCTFCNRCCTTTTLVPVSCYEPQRFASREEMEAEVLNWSANHGLPEDKPPIPEPAAAAAAAGE